MSQEAKKLSTVDDLAVVAERQNEPEISLIELTDKIKEDGKL